ncbi:MAG: SGNH/GDSL hydrolase family protein, partial [Acidobacteriota bacterium]
MRSKLLLALGSCAVSIALCEALLWLFAGTLYPTPWFPGDIEAERDATYDSLIGWKLPPNVELPEVSDEFDVTIRSNPQGFRSRHDFSQPTEDRKLAFLGDSYTFGSGVEDEETFASRLETLLPGSRSYNFGIGAFGIDQMWLTLRHYALPLEPDLVILSFIRYDLDRSLSSYRRDHIWREKPAFRLVGDELMPMTRDSRPSAIGRWIQQRSRLHQLWRKTEHSLSRRHAIGYRWRLNRALFEAIRDDC